MGVSGTKPDPTAQDQTSTNIEDIFMNNKTYSPYPLTPICCSITKNPTSGKVKPLPNEDLYSELPTAPITINGIKVLAAVDTRSTYSYITPALAAELKLPLSPFGQEVTLGQKGSKAKTLGITPETVIRCGDTSFNYAFKVFDLAEGNCLIGFALMLKLGINLTGVPAKFPSPSTDSKLNNPDTPAKPYELPSRFRGYAKDASLELDVTDPTHPDYVHLVHIYGLQLKSKLADLTSENTKITEFCTIPEAVIYLDTGNFPPSHRRQYPIAHTLKPIVSAQVDKWVQKGVVKETHELTAWNHPLTVAPKKDSLGNASGHRVCIDPRKLNEMLTDVNYPLPLIEDILEALSGFCVVSRVDLSAGFNQFQIHGPDQIKTSFIWEGRHYCFVGSPFGIKTIPSVFQKVMGHLFRDLPFVLVYIDDIIIHSRTFAEHAKHIQIVIRRLTSSNLKMNPDKCEFGRTEMIILGHCINIHGISLDKSKLVQLESWTKPKTGNQLEKQLGLLNYFRDCVPMYSKLSGPLDKLRKVKDLTTVWTELHDDCYNKLVKVLHSGMLMSFPNFLESFYIDTDASNRGLGAVLYQNYGNKMRYVKFASRSLAESEFHYGATKRELLAVIFALNKFRKYVWGTKFTLYTDHKALTYIYTQKHLNPMLNNWLETLLDFNFDILYKQGILNILPDRLSRIYDADPIEEAKEVKLWSMTTRSADLPMKINGKIYEKLNQRWGQHDADAFSTASNSVLPIYYEDATALTIPWSNQRIWINTTPNHYMAIIDHIVKNKCRVTMITPHLPNAPWFAKLIPMQASPAVLIKHGSATFAKGIDPSLFKWEAMVAWNLDGSIRDALLNFEPFTLGHATAAANPSNASTTETTDVEEPEVTILPPTTHSELREPNRVTSVSDPKLQATLIERAHLKGHFGSEAMVKGLIMNGHYWPSMRSEAKTKVRSCLDCQRFNLGKHGYHPISTILAQMPWDHIGIDLAQISTSDAGYNYVLVVVDICTRFVFYRPLRTKTMEELVPVLFQLFCDIGFPKIIQSDNGLEFVNQMIRSLCSMANIDHRLITPYNPAANGVSEAWVKIMKMTVYKAVQGNLSVWETFLPACQYFANTKASRLHNSQPYALMFARPVNGFTRYNGAQALLSEDELLKRLEFMTQVVYPQIYQKSKAIKDDESAAYNKNKKMIYAHHFLPGSQVMAYDDLRSSGSEPAYEGPFTLVRRQRGGNYQLQGADGTEYIRPPHALKLVIQDQIQPEVEVEKIIDDKQINGHQHYLVKWKGRDTSLNQWVHHQDFSGRSIIQKYLKDKTKRLNPSARSSRKKTRI